MRAFAAVYLLATVAATAAVWPVLFQFDRYAYTDPGWAVTVDRLLDEGLTPTRDFAYCYGLLTLAVNRALFAVFGSHPQVVGGLSAAAALVIAGSVAVLLARLGVGRWPRAAAVLVVPLVAPLVNLPSPAHVLEPLLLVAACAAQASGRLPSSPSPPSSSSPASRTSWGPSYWPTR